MFSVDELLFTFFSPANVSEPSLDRFVPNLAWMSLFAIYTEARFFEKSRNQATNVIVPKNTKISSV